MIKPPVKLLSRVANVGASSLPALMQAGRPLYRRIAGYAMRAVGRTRSMMGGTTPPVALPAPPVPAEWAVYEGARPELRGWPLDTMIAIPGIEKLSPAFRSGLLEASERLSIPVDSLVTIISMETIPAFNPESLNPLPAAGLIQLTTGANLPGYDTPEKIIEIASWPAEKQLAIIEGYYRMQGPAVRGATPGLLYLYNFMPAHAPHARNAGYVLADSKADPKSFSRKAFNKNKGLDANKDGLITIGDLNTIAAQRTRSAKGKRIAIDGTISAGDGRPPPMSSPTPPPGASFESAGGLLITAIADDRAEPLVWVPVVLTDGTTVLVTADAVKARVGSVALRLPVSSEEATAIARELGWVLPSAEISDAIWRQAAKRIDPRPQKTATAAMDVVLRYNAAIDAQLVGVSDDDLRADVGKDWIVEPKSRGAVNYGWRVGGKPIQSPGHQHNAQHVDYSQVLRGVMRQAHDAQGHPVDLLDRYAAQGVPPEVLDGFR